MASIVKRKNIYSVVYRFIDKDGTEHQKWETCKNHKEAQKRKAEIENCQFSGDFIAPDSQTVSEFLKDFVNIYGEEKWGVSMYSSQLALIDHYINPFIGDLQLQKITTRVVDQYVKTLKKTPAVHRSCRQSDSDQFVTNKTIEKIIKLLRCAFGQAVRWELISKNPFTNAIVPKTQYKERDIWDEETIQKALDNCTDSRLYVAMNLAFACSMRMGEILGLTWKNVHISDEDIAKNNAYIYVEQELNRCSNAVLQILNEKDIYFIFPTLFADCSTRLVLKKPKTDSSIRKIWMPKTVAYILRQWKKDQEEVKEFVGSEYTDYDLVFALSNGRPCEDRLINKAFAELKEKAGLPNVVFHSLRHSSVTYKLKLSHGDIKATQGDTGHAQADMVTRIYSHILDQDRKITAQNMESDFYERRNSDLRKVIPPENVNSDSIEATSVDLVSLMTQLQENPELAKMLADIVNAQKS